MATPKKTAPKFAAERARMAILARVNPIRGLTPERLASHLESFDLGHLRYAALTWQKIKDRCDTTKTVAEKRELSASLLNWEVLTLDESPQADAHKQALEDFYNGITATHALDQNQRGGVALLIKQMMHAVGHKYAVHEIVWKPGAPALTAEFRFVPLQFFENTVGRLRFLAQDYAAEGEDLEDGGWMVTTGPGLMEATAIAYLFKQLPLKSWLILCEKFAVPYLHGETPAAYGSTEWNAFRDALAAFVSDGSVITSPGAKITPIQITGTDTPQATLVDRMDRAIARLWRGADLGTMSQQGDATGSNPQEDETALLQVADAMVVSETLQHYVDREVIRQRFGAEPLAYFQLQPTARVNQELQLKIDDYLIKWKVPRGKRELLARYGRPEPEAGDELASAPVAPVPAVPGAEPAVLANQKADNLVAFLARSAAKALPAERAVLEPILRRVAQIEAMTDPVAQRAALVRFRAAWPEIARDAVGRVPTLARALETAIGPAVLSGFIEAGQKTLSHP